MKEILLSQSAKRELLTLAMARVGWEMAVQSWQRLRDANPLPGGRDYEIMAAPIVVLYARPFFENGGLTVLKEYEDFAGSPNPAEFKENHDRMIKARCRLVAHIDIPGSQELIYSRVDFDRTDYLAVKCEHDGSFTFETKCLLPDMIGSLAIPKLLAFQLSRIGNQTVDVADRILGRRTELGEVYRLINRESRKSGLE